MLVFKTLRRGLTGEISCSLDGLFIRKARVGETLESRFKSRKDIGVLERKRKGDFAGDDFLGRDGLVGVS